MPSYNVGLTDSTILQTVHLELGVAKKAFDHENCSHQIGGPFFSPSAPRLEVQFLDAGLPTKVNQDHN